MKIKRIGILAIIIVLLLLLTVLVTNIIYNKDVKYLTYSYGCCDSKNGTIYYQAPCECESDKDILEKTLIVLGIKEN